MARQAYRRDAPAPIRHRYGHPGDGGASPDGERRPHRPASHRLYSSFQPGGSGQPSACERRGPRMAVKDQEPSLLTEKPAADSGFKDSAYKEEVLETLAEARQRWEAAEAKAETQVPFWKRDFTTVSGMEVPQLVTPEQVAGIDPVQTIGVPGEYPYTRGIHPTGYRGKLWTMRQFAG